MEGKFGKMEHTTPGPSVAMANRINELLEQRREADAAIKALKEERDVLSSGLHAAMNEARSLKSRLAKCEKVVDMVNAKRDLLYIEHWADVYRAEYKREG